jgi:GntR family transcriptional regulator/MocR family aminotransferase
MRAIYAKRRQALLSALHESFERWLEPIPSLAGLHLAAYTRAVGDADAAAEWAHENDIGIYSLRPFYVGKPTRSGLVFGYGALEERAIKEGLSRLRRFWRR